MKNPALMDTFEFLDWADQASVEQLEWFASSAGRIITNQVEITTVGEDGPEVFVPTAFEFPEYIQDEIIYDVIRRRYINLTTSQEYPCF